MAVEFLLTGNMQKDFIIGGDVKQGGTEWLGLNTRTKNFQALKVGEARDSLNWLTGTYKDHIELRMGTALLGKTRNGAGKVTGLAVGVSNGGKQVPYFSFNRKINFYDSDNDDTHEVGTDILPTAANGEDIAFVPYSNLAGAWMYFSSQHSSIFKINLANLSTFIDMASTDARGFITVNLSRMFLWNTFNGVQNVFDKNNLKQSVADKKAFGSYTSFTNEIVGSGDGATKTFTHTLTNTPGADHDTAFAVTATDSNETFTDDANGNMIGSLGGTGTINYITGALNITFNTAPAVGVNNITCNYFVETKTGSIVDFSFSNPRTSGQGNIYIEYGGGNIQTSLAYNGNLYQIHVLKTWSLNIPADDTLAVDSIYRDGVGIPYWRAAYATDDGLFYLDFTNKNDPVIRILTLQQYSTNVYPEALSTNLDLTKNGFDAPVAGVFGNYYMMSCQGITNGVNDTNNDVSYFYNKISEVWDKLDYGFTCVGNFKGGLLLGDPISNNLFQAFSGYDDDGSVINNFWVSGELNLDIEGLKRANRMVIDGYINPAQSFDVYLEYDSGNFVKVQTIAGNGSYVDNAQGVLVGSDTVGLQVVGAGAVANAFHFRLEFPINSPIFEFVSIKLQATQIGALQINEMRFRDIRFKGLRTLPTYSTVL